MKKIRAWLKATLCSLADSDLHTLCYIDTRSAPQRPTLMQTWEYLG